MMGSIMEKRTSGLRGNRRATLPRAGFGFQVNQQLTYNAAAAPARNGAPCWRPPNVDARKGSQSWGRPCARA
jgi:hypothetical protein